MRGRLSKVEMEARLMRHKNQLYDHLCHRDWTAEQKHSAQVTLSEILDIVSEYYQ